MKNSFKTRHLVVLAAAVLTVGMVHAETALEKALAEPGAKPNIPVTQVKKGFDKSFIDDANSRFGNFHLQMGGDHALYYTINLTKYMPAELAMPHGEVWSILAQMGFKEMSQGRNFTIAVEEGFRYV